MELILSDVLLISIGILFAVFVASVIYPFAKKDNDDDNDFPLL